MLIWAHFTRRPQAKAPAWPMVGPDRKMATTAWPSPNRSLLLSQLMLHFSVLVAAVALQMRRRSPSAAGLAVTVWGHAPRRTLRSGFASSFSFSFS
jgi:hypothetical protein